MRRYCSCARSAGRSPRKRARCGVSSPPSCTARQCVNSRRAIRRTSPDRRTLSTTRTALIISERRYHAATPSERVRSVIDQTACCRTAPWVHPPTRALHVVNRAIAACPETHDKQPGEWSSAAKNTALPRRLALASGSKNRANRARHWLPLPFTSCVARGVWTKVACRI
jgi:hypothetical protein